MKNTTFLTPVHIAQPVRDPATIGTFLIGAKAAAIPILGTTLGTLVGSIAISLVTSWAMAALAPKPQGVAPRGLQSNVREAAAAQEYVYGQVRKGGVITYVEATGTNNKYLHQIIVLAGHEVEEIGDIYINDEIVTLDTNGFVTDAPWNSKIRIKTYDGSQTSYDSAGIVAESAILDTSFVGKGIAYMYVRMDYDQNVFANGIPLFTAVVKGRKVYDPRSDTTAYSNNAALCIRDYIASEIGLGDSDIDDTLLGAAANVCDENVSLAAGGTEKRYTMNGVVSAETPIGNVLTEMMPTCAGALFWGGGTWRLKAGDYTAPVKTFTLSDLRSGISLDTRVSMRDNFNAVQGTFNDAEQDWIEVSYPTLESSTFLGEDNNVRSALDFNLPFVTSAATAQRLAKLTLFRGREQMTFRAEFGMAALEVEPGDIVALTIPRYGWIAKEFEVMDWSFATNDEGGDLRVAMSLRETSEDAFDWTAEETAITANNTALLSFSEVPTVGIPAENISPEIRIIREKITEVISIEVTSARSAEVDSVEVQYKADGASNWIGLGSGPLGVYELVDPEPGEYVFRARAINGLGFKGEWTTTSAVQTAGSATAPSDVTGFFYEISERTSNLEWDAVSDLDLSYYRIRHAVETSGATWANSTTAVDKVPRPGTTVSLPTRPGTYLIKAYDKTGLSSTNAASVVVTSDEIPAFGTTLTQTDSPTFSGAKTDCEVASSKLQITDPSTGPSEATYDFSTYIETGDSTARIVRARVDAAVERSDESAGLFDDQPGLFDAAPGNFDDLGGSSQFADTNVLFYISTTTDDPAGSPTWSDYKQFRVGDFYGRAFRFRVVLKSSTDNVTPAISSLTARVEY